MFQIQNTLVTLDIVEEFFCCDLERCLGACCIEGDAGAPVTPAEVELIEKALPVIEEDMLPRAVEEVREQGVAYTDERATLSPLCLTAATVRSPAMARGECVCVR